MFRPTLTSRPPVIAIGRWYVAPSCVIQDVAAATLNALYTSTRGSNDRRPVLKLLRRLKSHRLIEGSVEVPIGSTVTACVPCVSRTVFACTRTVFLSGQPWKYEPEKPVLNPFSSSKTPDTFANTGTSCGPGPVR